MYSADSFYLPSFSSSSSITYMVINIPAETAAPHHCLKKSMSLSSPGFLLSQLLGLVAHDCCCLLYCHSPPLGWYSDGSCWQWKGVLDPFTSPYWESASDHPQRCSVLTHDLSNSDCLIVPGAFTVPSLTFWIPVFHLILSYFLLIYVRDVLLRKHRENFLVIISVLYLPAQCEALEFLLWLSAVFLSHESASSEPKSLSHMCTYCQLWIPHHHCRNVVEAIKEERKSFGHEPLNTSRRCITFQMCADFNSVVCLLS